MPELIIAAIVACAATATGYAAAGPAGAAAVAIIAAAAALVVMRTLILAADTDDDAPADWSGPVTTLFTGYWRKRAGLADAEASMPAYDAELRLTLQHLLAARLAERHGISLHDDPAAARRALCPRPRDEALWHWIDPARPSVPASGKSAGGDPPAHGIPPRTLARLIDRLERL